MRIRHAKRSDKQPVIQFCTHTFRWGDYIDRIWDKWYAKKNLYTVEQNGNPIGICNASLSSDQVWIEGIRIHPDYRRHGYASKLIMIAEKLAKRKKISIVRMIIAKNNKRSLALAKKMGYHIESNWCLYNLPQKKQKSLATIVHSREKLSLLDSITYSESWNWFALDENRFKKLVKAGRIIVYKEKKPEAVGIWNRSSKLDDDVLQLGFLRGTVFGQKEILKFIQNKAYEQQKDRIQILVQNEIKVRIQGLEKRMLFCLLKKKL